MVPAVTGTIKLSPAGVDLTSKQLISVPLRREVTVETDIKVVNVIDPFPSSVVVELIMKFIIFSVIERITLCPAAETSLVSLSLLPESWMIVTFQSIKSFLVNPLLTHLKSRRSPTHTGTTT